MLVDLLCAIKFQVDFRGILDSRLFPSEIQLSFFSLRFASSGARRELLSWETFSGPVYRFLSLTTARRSDKIPATSFRSAHKFLIEFFINWKGFEQVSWHNSALALWQNWLHFASAINLIVDCFSTLKRRVRSEPSGWPLGHGTLPHSPSEKLNHVIDGFTRSGETFPSFFRKWEQISF